MDRLQAFEAMLHDIQEQRKIQISASGLCLSGSCDNKLPCAALQARIHGRFPHGVHTRYRSCADTCSAVHTVAGSCTRHTSSDVSGQPFHSDIPCAFPRTVRNTHHRRIRRAGARLLHKDGMAQLCSSRTHIVRGIQTCNRKGGRKGCIRLFQQKGDSSAEKNGMSKSSPESI